MARGNKRYSFRKGKRLGNKGKGHTKSKSKEWEKKFNEFQEELKKKGLYMRDVEGDGNCMFRAISDQITGDESSYEQFRLIAVDYIKAKKDYFALFLEDDENIDVHIASMSKDGVWGGDFELVALSDMLEVKFCIHMKDQPPFVVKAVGKKRFSKVVHLAYHTGEHYSSVRRLGDDKTEPALEIQMQLPDDSDEDEVVDAKQLSILRKYILKGRVKTRALVRRLKRLSIKTLFSTEDSFKSKHHKKNDYKIFLYFLFFLMFLKIILFPY